MDALSGQSNVSGCEAPLLGAERATRSLGAIWLDLGIEAAREGGYARELSDEEKAQQQQALTDAINGFAVLAVH